MPKYYGLILSPNMEMTPEGYLICKDVPLCRSGFQEYLGKELEGFDGYEASWNLEPEKKYKVYRPEEEVLHPDFIASLEGKSVVDEHPDGNVVHVDNERELNCGHTQNVRKGEKLDGEVTLQGDLVIKDPDLIEKIRPEADPKNEYGTATRDVSCGYGLRLARLEDGTIVMRKLRGNHVAVVEKGRAGPQFAIGDSAPPEIKTIPREPIMSFRDLILGRGLKAVLPDATPDETKLLLDEFNAGATSSATRSKTAVDAEPEMHPAHGCLENLLKSMKAGDAAGMASHKADLMKHIGHEEPEKKETLEELEEEQPQAGDEELEQEEKTPAEEDDETHATDGESAEKQIDDPGASILKAANDSAREHIKGTRPLMALLIAKPRSTRTNQEQIAIDSYQGMVKKLNKNKGNAYKHLANPKVPKGIEGVGAIAADASVKNEKVCTCFDGVPYRLGKEKHNQTCLKENK